MRRLHMILGATLLTGLFVAPLATRGAGAEGRAGLSRGPMRGRSPAFLTAQRARDTFDDIRVKPADEQMRKIESKGEAPAKRPEPQKTDELKKVWDDWLLGLGKKRPAEDQTKASGPETPGLGAQTPTGGSSPGSEAK